MSGVTLLALNNAGFKTTAKADELNTKLMTLLGLKARYEPARLAIARSLSVASPPEIIPEESDSDGKIINGQNLFGDDLGAWVALIVEHAKADDCSAKDLQDLVRRHWHRGIHLIFEEWNRCGGDFDKFILQLAGRAGMRDGAGLPAGEPAASGTSFELKVGPVLVRIGSPGIDVATQEPIAWTLNAPGTSPHVALMGTLGTGKTRTAKQMIGQIRTQAGCPVILFDMAKGDLAQDRQLAAMLGAKVINAPASPVPLDVLHIPDRTNSNELINAAMRFRESFQRVTVSRPGGAQLDALRDAAQRALKTKSPTTIVDVRDQLRDVYAEKKRKEDAVVATFNDLTSWHLFEPTFSPADFFSRSWIINVAEATETAQRLIVFLILDALYALCRSLPDSAMDTKGNRALRLVIGIDEARKVLGYGQQSLISLVRESRSKGMAVFLISQSPDDYDQEDENFLENIGLAVSFRTNAQSSGAIRAVLGQPIDLGSLPKGVCATRLPGKPGVVRVQAWTE